MTSIVGLEKPWVVSFLGAETLKRTTNRSMVPSQTLYCSQKGIIGGPNPFGLNRGKSHPSAAKVPHMPCVFLKAAKAVIQ